MLVAQRDGTATPSLPAIATAPVAPTVPPAPAALTAVAAPNIAAPPPATAAPTPATPGPMFGSLFSSERRDGVSPFVRELSGARSASLVQPASAPAALLDPGTTQSASAPAAAISPSAVTAPEATHRMTHDHRGGEPRQLADPSCPAPAR